MRILNEKIELRDFESNLPNGVISVTKKNVLAEIRWGKKYQFNDFKEAKAFALGYVGNRKDGDSLKVQMLEWL